ncbi:MAG: hypothetical protein UR26_C0003G0137 [candidate division TM6 bacterium GW2011_GWF2_32_72]|nr:MAG: hypothetical protein UR26_C0003G0137 [candidate division TM6 bacterium GW2011_GWF2_32_72]
MEPNNWMDSGKGWLDSLKQSLSWEQLEAKYGITQARLIEFASYFGIGFFAGFLFKKYFLQVLFYVLLITAVLFGLYYFDLITIDWTKVKALLGIKEVSVEATSTVANKYFEWAKANIVLIISAFLGFILGFKLG